LVGRVPIEVERRSWVRSIDKPCLVWASDWVTQRVLFSVTVYPPVDELDPRRAEAAHFERVRQVKEVIARGAGDLRLSLLLETEWDLRWDNGREVWVDGASRAHDASRFGIGSRAHA